MKSSLLRSGVLDDPSQISKWRTSFMNGYPFRWLCIENFLSEGVLDQLEEKLMSEVQFYEKENDLFSFKQSSDLKEAAPSGIVNEFVDVIYGKQFRDVLTDITGATLIDTIDITASVYTNTNMLLCHDDRLLGRRLAYVFYAVSEDWSKEDGGELTLFTLDKEGNPDCIAEQIVPKRNSIVIFEVSKNSFHQVSEVLGTNYRLTLHGWFHGPSATSVPPPVVTPLDNKRRLETISDLLPVHPPTHSASLNEWISPVYLNSKNIENARKRFEEDSSIQLQDFITESQFAKLVAEFQSHENWKGVGPYQRRNFDVSGQSSIFENLLNTFESIEMMDYLQKLTGVDLDTVHARVRRFKTGSYEVACDANPESNFPGIDVCLCCVTDWTPSENLSGSLVYVDPGEEEPLMCIDPIRNSLNIVFRGEPGIQVFVKYLNHSIPSPRYDLMMTCRQKLQD